MGRRAPLYLLLLLGCGRTSFFGVDRAPAPAREDAGQPCSSGWSAAHGHLDVGSALVIGRVFVVDHRVMFARTAGPGAEVEIVRRDLRDMGETVLGRGQASLVDADARTALVAMNDGSGELRAMRDDRATMIGVGRGGGPGPYIDGSFVGGCTSPSSVGGVDLDSGQHFETLIQFGPCTEPTFLSGRDIVYRTSTRRQQTIVHYAAVENPALEQSLFMGPDVGVPGVFGGSAYFLASGAVVSVPLDNSTPPKTVKGGPCAFVQASGAGVLIGCDPAVEGRAGVTLAKTLWLFDGEVLTQLKTGGQPILEAHLGDGFAAFLAYDSTADLCLGSPAAGHVFATTLDTHQLIEVASIDAPCLCCAASNQVPFLSVRGAELAFNHDPGSGQSGIGLGRVDRSCP